MIKAKDLKAIKAGEITVDELLNNYPVKALVSDLIEIVANKTATEPVVVDRIVITQEQFDTYFRIKGFDVNGAPSTRGRKPKTIKAE